MDLRQLEYFVRVAELGSFTRAADALGVAQPAISRQVRLLEVELRHHLLQRNGRGAVPTEAGAALLEHARGILHQVERTREELARLRGGLAGRVTLGLPPSVARVLAVPLMRAFRAQLPDASLAITEGLSTAMQEQLISGRLDVAVLYNAQPVAGVEIEPLGAETLVLVQPAGASSGSPVRLEALARLPLVIPSRPNAIRMHVEAELASAGLVPTIGLEIDGVPSILDLVAGGAGCAVLSRNAVAATPQPDAFDASPVLDRHGKPLRIALFTAISALRPATGTQKAALDLVRALSRTHLTL